MSQNWDDVHTYEDLTYNRKKFCDWLATPEPFRDISNQTELAEELGVSRETLSRWKGKKTFIRIEKKRKREIVGIEGLNKVIDTVMTRAASDRKDANEAAELFLNWYYNQDFTQGDTVNQYNQPNYAKRAEEVAKRINSEDREDSESGG